MAKKFYDFTVVISGCFLAWVIISLFSISINAPEAIADFSWNIFTLLGKI